ncbi:phycobilisome protein [Pseudanabaenaceae cyanobacterium LEGE 13415]|nr:phycobilisome protein [Pseudanabaenaceae cyanobacterium LEGE 13415]
MQSPIDGIFDEAENCYLKPEELQAIGHYVVSIAERMSAYRALRDRELELIQQAADQLELEMPGVETAVLERAIKNGMLTLRHCGMAMLLNDPNFVQKRLLNWLKDSIELHQAQGADAAFFGLMKQQLQQSLNAQQMALLEPFLTQVETVIPAQQKEEMLTIAGIF